VQAAGRAIDLLGSPSRCWRTSSRQRRWLAWP